MGIVVPLDLIDIGSSSDTIIGAAAKKHQTSDDIVVIQITLNQRPQHVKVAIYKAIAARLAKNPGMRPEDVLISPVPVGPEDWLFGDGKAQYVKTD